jgi:hypothetical protein
MNHENRLKFKYYCYNVISWYNFKNIKKLNRYDDLANIDKEKLIVEFINLLPRDDIGEIINEIDLAEQIKCLLRNDSSYRSDIIFKLKSYLKESISYVFDNYIDIFEEESAETF